MNQDSQQNQEKVQAETPAPQKKPNETGTINVEGFVRIFDPNTNEKFVEKRA